MIDFLFAASAALLHIYTKYKDMKQSEQMEGRDMYLHQGKTQTEIAELMGIDRKTVYNWIKCGAWEELKLVEAPRQCAGSALQPDQ